MRLKDTAQHWSRTFRFQPCCSNICFASSISFPVKAMKFANASVCELLIFIEQPLLLFALFPLRLTFCWQNVFWILLTPINFCLAVECLVMEWSEHQGNFDCLDTYTQLYLFCFLDAESLSNCAQVCRSWNVLCSDSHVWKTLFQSNWATVRSGLEKRYNYDWKKIIAHRKKYNSLLFNKYVEDQQYM